MKEPARFWPGWDLLEADGGGQWRQALLWPLSRCTWNNLSAMISPYQVTKVIVFFALAEPLNILSESWKSIWRHLSHDLVLSSWTDIFAWDCSWGHCNRFVHRGGQFFISLVKLYTNYHIKDQTWPYPQNPYILDCKMSEILLPQALPETASLRIDDVAISSGSSPINNSIVPWYSLYTFSSNVNNGANHQSHPPQRLLLHRRRLHLQLQPRPQGDDEQVPTPHTVYFWPKKWEDFRYNFGSNFSVSTNQIWQVSL